jgi:hypothetical protein
MKGSYIKSEQRLGQTSDQGQVWSRTTGIQRTILIELCWDNCKRIPEVQYVESPFHRRVECNAGIGIGVTVAAVIFIPLT